MNYWSFTKAYIFWFTLSKIFSNMYFWILWLNIWSHVPWHWTVCLVKYSDCYHGLCLSWTCLPSDPSLLDSRLYHGEADTYCLQFPGCPDSWLLTGIDQGEVPIEYFRANKGKIRILLLLLFHWCSILRYSSVTLVSFDQVYSVRDSTVWFWL